MELYCVIKGFHRFININRNKESCIAVSLTTLNLCVFTVKLFLETDLLTQKETLGREDCEAVARRAFSGAVRRRSLAHFTLLLLETHSIGALCHNYTMFQVGRESEPTAQQHIHTHTI